MELGEERFHPGAGALAHAELFGHGGELGRVAPGKAIGMQTNLFFFSFWPLLGRFYSSCDVTQQSWDWNPPSVVGITRCSWAVPLCLGPSVNQ